MKTLKFNFNHPFKGHAIIKMLDTAKAFCKHFLIDSKDSNLLEIPVNKLQNGKYEVTLDWERDEKNYFYQEKIEIKDSTISAS